MPTIYSRAPTRIDLAGGWTDVPRFAEVVPGAVLNVAITLYSHVRVLVDGERGAPSMGRPISAAGSKAVSLYSVDYDEREELSTIRDVQNVELTGSFGLVKAALRRRHVEGRLDILTRSDAPPGSGLGTSASMGVALIAALNRAAGVEQSAAEMAETAVELETVELGILSGKQDHYAAALGGAQFMTFDGGAVSVEAVQMRRDQLAEFQRRFVLAYTGKSRLSSDLHVHVTERFEQRDQSFLNRLRNLTDTAREARSALLRGNYDELAQCITFNWEQQKALYNGITTREIDALEAVGRHAGAVAMKACGAGGGGCLLFLCDDGAEGLVARQLREAAASTLRFDVAESGAFAWSSS
ncbi:MAG: hypothetical protein O3A46_04000 [Candidatus Poribacteria bacterium]|nr:hypothetical protein [Candidatus Poribacteria bacterium]